MQQAMGALSRPVGMFLPTVVDFANVKTFCDVGGSAGVIAGAVKESAPHINALSLDLPSLTADVSKAPQPGVQYVGGDFFESVPPADVYSMKHILHDWPDDKCITILRNIHKAMQGDGSLIIVEAILPELGDTSSGMAKAVDLVMLNVASGKERTASEWKQLFANGGFRVVQTIDTPNLFKIQVLKKL